MKIVQINSTCGSGSTGKICVAVSELLTARDIENYILYTNGNSSYPKGKKYMSVLEVKWQALKSRIFGNYGFQSKKATWRLIAELESISPSIVHLHNLHSHNVHLGELFTYLIEKKIKVYWTFHDCWAFTAYCPHYDMIGCIQWRTGGCEKCPQKRHFSWFFDYSRVLFEEKKRLITGLDLTIITPSQWLADQVKQSFLCNTTVKIIRNGIDLSVFCPRESDFRKKYGLKDCFIVLGVAFGWGKRKGLDVFIELAEKLDERFKIVLVGFSEKVDKQLPAKILPISQTSNQVELAEIYSAANVFVNPTREENFPTTHLEALACGTPVIAFDTGGCAEMLEATCGCVVKKDDVSSLLEKIILACETKKYTREACISRAAQFNEKDRFLEYISLYMYN